jgi:hypothetical protein
MQQTTPHHTTPHHTTPSLAYLSDRAFFVQHHSVFFGVSSRPEELHRGSHLHYYLIYRWRKGFGLRSEGGGVRREGYRGEEGEDRSEG